MINVNRFLLVIAILILSIPFAAAKNPAIEFQLLSANIRLGVNFINLFLALLVIIFAISISRSATSAQEAWSYIAISTLFLALLITTQVLKGIKLLDVDGLENILRFLFLIFLTIGLYKLKHRPAIQQMTS